MPERTIYVVMALHRWDQLVLREGDIKFRMTTSEGEPTHYLHAFDTKEAAEAFSRGRWPISEVLDVGGDT